MQFHRPLGKLEFVVSGNDVSLSRKALTRSIFKEILFSRALNDFRYFFASIIVDFLLKPAKNFNAAVESA